MDVRLVAFSTSSVDLDVKEETKSMIRLRNFWQLEKAGIEELDLRHSNARTVMKQMRVPQGRIKKIMKLDQDVKGLRICQDSLAILAKASEMFIKDITLRAWVQAESEDRCLVRQRHISMGFSYPQTDMFDFLIDVMDTDSESAQEVEDSFDSCPAVSQVQMVQQPVQRVVPILRQQINPIHKCFQIVIPRQLQNQATSTVTTDSSGSSPLKGSRQRNRYRRRSRPPPQCRNDNAQAAASGLPSMEGNWIPPQDLGEQTLSSFLQQLLSDEETSE